MVEIKGFFQKINGQLVPIKAESSASYNQLTFSVSEDSEEETITLDGITLTDNDLVIVNYEGLMLIPGHQFEQIGNNQLKITSSLRKDTDIHVIVFKTGQ